MIQTISEKDKVTFIYKGIRLPIGLAIIGLLGLGAGIAIIPSFSFENVLALLMGAAVAFGIAYYVFSRKQVLVIDGMKDVLEEYVGKKMTHFEFKEVEYSDVERVRDDEAETTEAQVMPEELQQVEPETDESRVAETHTQKTKPHLNYHPFLKLKNESTKYFVFDNKGMGLSSYRDAKAVVEKINEYIGVPKVTAENLNLYKIKPGTGKSVALLLVGLAMLIIVAGILLRYLGYV